jgi:membrane protein
MKGIWTVVGRTFSDWYADRAPRLGAALAYYTVFALAPSLVIVIGVAGLVLGRESAQSQILEQIRDLVGEQGAQAVEPLGWDYPRRGCSASQASRTLTLPDRRPD